MDKTSASFVVVAAGDDGSAAVVGGGEGSRTSSWSRLRQGQRESSHGYCKQDIGGRGFVDVDVAVAVAVAVAVVVLVVDDDYDGG